MRNVETDILICNCNCPRTSSLL